MNSSPPRGDLTNTHTYDGKLQWTKAELIQEISRVTVLPKEAKLQAFNQLRLALQRYAISPSAQKCFEIIFQTFAQSERGKPNNHNYDSANDLYADDLLYLCFEKVVLNQDVDFAQALILQLEDMTSGLCAQGRTTRLFQILLAF